MTPPLPERTRATLRALLDRLAAVEEEIARLEAERAAIRSAIGEVVTTLPDQAATVGEYHIRVVAPTTVVAYDARRLDAVIADIAARDVTIAQLILAHRRETERAGGLRITRRPDPTPPAEPLGGRAGT